MIANHNYFIRQFCLYTACYVFRHNVLISRNQAMVTYMGGKLLRKSIVLVNVYRNYVPYLFQIHNHVFLRPPPTTPNPPVLFQRTSIIAIQLLKFI